MGWDVSQGVCVGRINLELPNRRWGGRRRARQMYLGCLLPRTRSRPKWRHGGRRVRSLSPMARRYRSALGRWVYRVSVLNRLVSHSAVGRWVDRTPGSRFLRQIDRWAACKGFEAVALPLSLGPSAGASGGGRMA